STPFIYFLEKFSRSVVNNNNIFLLGVPPRYARGRSSVPSPRAQAVSASERDTP
ncbi:MAG TPA: hypothetical protein GXZ40_06110, partial [Bacteroidales bacterium]|nr:hypothetical protein [Bacteroidales bacterium]